MLTQLALRFDNDGLALERQMILFDVASYDLQALGLGTGSLLFCEPLDYLGPDQKMKLFAWLITCEGIEGGRRFGRSWSLIRAR